MAELENVAWRSWNTTRAVSNLHQRIPDAQRTKCGLKIPVDGVEGELLAEPFLVQREDWEGLLCERCFPDEAEIDRPRASRARWHARDRERDLAVGAHTDLWDAGVAEVWENHRGGTLIRFSDRWQLRRHRAGASGRYDTYELVDGARPKLKAPTGWANRVLRTGQS